MRSIGMATRTCINVLCGSAAFLSAIAFAQEQTASVDWKAYGAASLGEQTLCFYDAKGVVHVAGDHVRVWTKCLSQKALDGVDTKTDHGDLISKEAARKIVQGYVPPIASLQSLDADQGLAVTVYEVTANTGSVQPQASILYELNCPERMMHELSMSIRSGGKGGFSDKPTSWRHVPPEGNGAALLKLLCPARRLHSTE